jgi:DNA helicase-2/ATP-dependent DNA helicase PcrA
MSGVPFEELTGEQKEVADSTVLTMLVLGGAGVGKTTTALWAARRELTDHGRLGRPVLGRRVLFVTFSRTAVAQIRSRASGVLTGIADSVEIVTFHGLAYRLVCGFGRYVGIEGAPMITGEARTKLGRRTAQDGTELVYDDLMPLALRLVKTPGLIGDLIRTRWCLVICDEFQDTDDAEWRLLQQLGLHARLLLLADPNQMIYGYKKGVSELRLDAARSRPGCVEFVLPPGSHRDPTQVIPDAAAEIRWRRFDTEPVRKAVTEGRLVVYADVPDEDTDRGRAIAEQVARLRAEGHSSIGIYAKTNLDTAGLSAALTECGLEHVPIGFGEAYGESLAAMVTMMQFASGEQSWEDVRWSLGVVLTATVRSPDPPPVAVAFRDGIDLPGLLGSRLAGLRASLMNASDALEATEVAAAAWEALGFTSGRRAWRRAGRTLIALTARYRAGSGELLNQVAASVARIRDESFVELDSGDTGQVQLMNFHQTKGREADAIVLSHTSNDWYGRGGEPYEEPSRVLYVSMTRARHKVVVLLPSSPHALVAQLLQHAVHPDWFLV